MMEDVNSTFASETFVGVMSGRLLIGWKDGRRYLGERFDVGPHT